MLLKHWISYIRMISEGSCDWSNGYWKLNFANTWINYSLQYIKIENTNSISQYYWFDYISDQTNAG